MNEMVYMPLMWGIVLGTALLSAVVTTALPYVPKWWNALKSRIKRKSNVPEATDMVDIIIIAQLTERIDDLEEQLTNVVEAKYTRDRNRKNNIRRDVREYLKELQK
jgi:hypothetical protein